jgi:hypothetical protein
MHSVKNRWLLRIKNMTGRVYSRFWLPITVRDLMVVGACLTREFGSLPAFLLVAKKWRTTWRKRAEIMRRKRVDDAYLASWIAFEPISIPAPEIAETFYSDLQVRNQAALKRGAD